MIIGPVEIGFALAKKNKYDKLILVHTAANLPCFAGFSKKSDPKLLKDFNRTLVEMRTSGELKTLLAKHDVSP